MDKEKLMALGLTEEAAQAVLDLALPLFKKSAEETEKLKAENQQLQAEQEKAAKAHEAELRTLKIENAVDAALSAAGAKSHVAAKALMADFLGKAELLEDGSVKGLPDAVKKLAESGDTAFLFEQRRLKGAKPAQSSSRDAGMTLEAFRKLTPAERLRFSAEHPDEYKELYRGRAVPADSSRSEIGG